MMALLLNVFDPEADLVPDFDSSDDQILTWMTFSLGTNTVFINAAESFDGTSLFNLNPSNNHSIRVERDKNWKEFQTWKN